MIGLTGLADIARFLRCCAIVASWEEVIGVITGFAQPRLPKAPLAVGRVHSFNEHELYGGKKNAHIETF